MNENSVCEIDLVPVTFWPPALARRLTHYSRQIATIAIVGGSIFGIALGFAGVGDQNDTLFQSMAQSLATFTGLIG
jgi:hypothetical protein